jgi:hypothetical protein
MVTSVSTTEGETVTTYTASLLAPKRAEAYIYDSNRILGEISAPSGSFIWCGETIDTTRTPDWVHVVISGSDAAEVAYRLNYQADRIRSGMHPVYVSEIDSQ